MVSTKKKSNSRSFGSEVTSEFSQLPFTSSSTCVQIEEKLNKKFCGWKPHFERRRNHGGFERFLQLDSQKVFTGF